MTVQTNTNSIAYIGNGSTVHYDYDFLILDDNHLKVYFGDVLQVSGYVVSGVGSQSGGTVAFSVAPPNLTDITFTRDVPFLQLTDYQPYDAFPADSHERALDLLTMMAQQLKDSSDRSLRYPVGGSKWDAKGNEIINVGAGASDTSAPNVGQVKSLIAQLAGPDSAAALRVELAQDSGADLVGTDKGATVQDVINRFTFLDDYQDLVVSGDWAPAMNAALATGLPVMPNPTRIHNVSGYVQSSRNLFAGPIKINPTRAALSGLGQFTFNPGGAPGDTRSGLKLVYCLRAYDLIELMYIRSMGFNAIFHGGDLLAERPAIDIIDGLNKMLDNAYTARLSVNMTTGYILNEDSQAIGYVNAFKDHPAVWGFSVFDEPTFNGVTLARQTDRLAALRAITNKNLNVTDVIQNYTAYRNGYNPWAHGYDTFFVDSYSHNVGATQQDKINNDIADMRVALGVAAAHCPEANVIPMCGMFKHTGFSTDIVQIKAAASVFVRAGGGDFGVFTWDAVEEGLTTNLLTGSDLRAVAISFCDLTVKGKRIPIAYQIGGSSVNPDDRPPVSARRRVDLMRKRDYAIAFLGSGTALGVLKNGADAEFTTTLLSSGQSRAGLFFRGQFPIAIMNIEMLRNLSVAATLFDVTGSKSGSLTIHYSSDEGGTVSTAAFTQAFAFTGGAPSLDLNVDLLSGDFWRGHKLVFAQAVNPTVDAVNYRCGLHGFVITSEW